MSMDLNPYPSSSISGPSNSTPIITSRPQQYGLNNINHQPSIIRQTPPSATLQTPSQHRRSRHQTPQQQHYAYRQRFDSPFTSPAPSYPTANATTIRSEPLVLDPTKQSTPAEAASSSSSHSRRSNRKVMHQLLEAATRGMRDTTAIVTPGMSNTPHQSNQLTNSIQTMSMHGNQPYGASVLARSAPQAGFLQKMGVNIPEFKRRFFVLKPATHLYYYLSPHDTEPRGHVDLEGCNVEELEETPDGRYRFAIILNEEHSQMPRRIILEARSKEVGQEWMRSFDMERVSTLKDKLADTSSKNEANLNRIKQLEREVEDYKMVEKDRDGALEDARRWKAQFERIDEALRLLTQQIRRPPSTSPTPDQPEGEDDKVKVADNGQVSMEGVQQDENTEGDETASSQSSVNSNSKPASSALLDITIDEDKDIADIFEVPGRYFSGLSNACHQQRESLRLASIEASTAVEDLHGANAKLQAMEKRMEKAEKHLCKLWEENCSIRKTLKQKKREKRVLVREVKALQQLVKDGARHEKAARPPSRQSAPVHDEAEEPLEESTLIGSDEERLIIELEEHVASSIRLHDRFLVASGERDPRKQRTSKPNRSNLEARETQTVRPNPGAFRHGPSLRIENKASSVETSPLQPKILSLFDDDQSESGSDVEEDSKSLQSLDVSSVGAEMGDPVEFSDSIQSTDFPEIIHPTADSPERPNPLVQLDEDDDEEENDKQPNLFSTSTQSTSSKSVITDNGHATSRLVCPLADVVETKEDPSPSGTYNVNDELEVYHLTFYTKKIGIQFQKAPPPPSQSKGLLTDAMTADLDVKANGSSKTAAELRSIASISTWAKSGRDINGEEVCQVATPKDIVLVCGFEGFDDSGNNSRPKLGARLVAFDGVSVEVGHWTFTSIRKAIQARTRPLTLSFRNDYLTTEQRAVLTKAVKDIDAPLLNSGHTVQQRPQERPPSTTPSITSALSHETDYFVNETDSQTQNSQQDDDFSTSVSSSNNRATVRGFSTANSVSTHQSNFRSFSEAGSSSVISTTFAPLMANLMKGISDREPFTPEYLSREPEYLDNTSQHQDFKSNLL